MKYSNSNSKLIVCDLDGIARLILSASFLDRQKCWKNLEKIKEVSQLRMIIFSMMENTDNRKELRSLAADLTELEFELQDLYKFKRNTNFHRFWELPKCTCPKLDNYESYGTKYYIIDTKCIIHGN